ncbi:GDSL-type esterase/lipase family protein [Acidaminococcus sp. NSJ-142]|jgi:lysophospholipase L1-like esterase|uniref:GDSL-type esterase/lipase family protein n=1 Tax=Acidaminococcus TaxID=904 RepID=UPI000CFA07D1|nr:MULTISPECIES: GDSL-type esterase/lipase family protein [Acidaminococcus]MCD2435047.1 GDSL-type esterase/lipase family protein [Acidaminococcus hominis]MCH4096436.1 GDSL-type esterase/lipase family protein [Acidaminococcus provencensis]RHK02888.1 G-D-S-L family lipolytic protein [Acidaminococcus sp. AM05-11]
MKMAFIGDSLVSCPNVTLTETWPDIAGKKLGLEVVNNAAGGKLTLVMRGMFPYDVLNENADGVFILCGMRDIMLDEPMSSIEENIQVTLDKAQEAGLKVIVLGKPPLTTLKSAEAGWQVPSEVDKHNEALKTYRAWLDEEAARRNLPVLDFQEVLTKAAAESGKELLLDGLHPNAEGYKAVAAAFVKLMEESRALA